MKRCFYIIPAVLVIASACSSLRFTGANNDDLYYRPSENTVAVTTTIAQGRIDGQAYYDNIYAGDTLIADEYVPVDEYSAYAAADEQTIVNNYYGSVADRIYLFSDDYFYPYWRDPFYYSPFSMRLGLGYGYWGPYTSLYSWGYDPYYYDYYYPYYYPYSHLGYYPYYSWYSPYSYYNYYGGYYSYYGYSPWYFGYGYPYLQYYEGGYVQTVARRGGYSSMSRGSYSNTDTRTKSGYAPSGDFNSRRVTSGTTLADGTGNTPTGSRRTTAIETLANRNAAATGTTTAARRTQNGTVSNATQGTATVSRPEYARRESGSTNVQNQTRTQSPVRSETATQTRTQQQTPVRTQTQTVNRPQYQPAERSYTPSYNNPRVSSRPTYNTTRINTGVNTQSSGTVINRATAPRSSSTTPAYTTTPSRSSSPVQYAAPSRSSSGSSYSTGSRSSGSSYSSGSRSFGSGISSGSSGGSFSSGSSGGSRSSGVSNSSSSSSSSGGRSDLGSRR